MVIGLKTHIKIALAYFLLAALLGVLLRFFTVFGIPITYKYFVHTHSHIALLGWVYMALTTLIYKSFIESSSTQIKYLRVFWFTQMTVIGMLLTFPFQGYALFSIIFSTLFLFASYWFFRFFTKHVKLEFKKNNSYKCVKWALWFMVISSLGPWVLGIIMNTLGAESIWYRMAIYFYLHFQYNGWMVLALFGLLFFVLEQNEIPLPKKTFKSFFWAINLGIVLTFFLSTLWAVPSLMLYILGGIGALFQLYALLVVLRFIGSSKNNLKTIFTKFQKKLLRTVLILLSVKMLLQLLSAIPYFSSLAATYLDLTIGYLHWTFLGVVSITLFVLLHYLELLSMAKRTYHLYLLGFIVTEGLIFYKGIAAWQGYPVFKDYPMVLAIGSLLIPLGLLFLFLSKHKEKP